MYINYLTMMKNPVLRNKLTMTKLVKNFTRLDDSRVNDFIKDV